MLDVRDLTVEFPTRRGVLRALDGVSLSIAPGEILGMVGESGAGKSLTGAAIMGFLEPPGRISRGTISLGGQEIQALSPDRMRALRGRRIAAIFQDPQTSLNPLMTVGEQIVETIRTHFPVTRAAAQARAVAWLQDVGIPAPRQRFDAYPFELSGGMRQRVVIALALCAEPALVVADEPTTALDASVQAQILILLRRIVKEHGTAVMLITHDMGVIAEMADRVAVLYAGRVAEIGPVRSVVRNGRHPYTRGLMASIPDLHARRERLDQIRGSMPRLDALPPGCRFSPRCDHAMPVCTRAMPELMEAGEAQAACWLLSPDAADEPSTARRVG